MRKLIILLLIVISFFVIGCLDELNGDKVKKEEKSPDGDLREFLEDNSSRDEIRNAILEALEENEAGNNYSNITEPKN